MQANCVTTDALAQQLSHILTMTGIWTILFVLTYVGIMVLKRHLIGRQDKWDRL
jgi:hypothetical protein